MLLSKLGMTQIGFRESSLCYSIGTFVDIGMTGALNEHKDLTDLYLV